ncbi:MAG TPA: glycoside hydrolase family 3 C-terminal domain-containing protein, partial [Candidatus Acidoferrum sp.]|nr:glycoside hydrolase family 3 C-terminal domain-containing protein [Candidatus Acidoferrum sp.]
RWGRCAESPGEDPLLGSVYAKAMVEGFQGHDLAQADNMLSCAKHFAGYGFADGGRDYNAADITPYRMHNAVLPPFKAAVEAGVGAIMVGFHDLAGIPCTAHRELLDDLLRKTWGFDGLLVSDYTAILELINHGVAADLEHAALLAFTAGVDIDLVSEAYVKHLPALVRQGRVSVEAVDAACRRVLVTKKKLGLFDNPYRGLDPELRNTVCGAPLHRQLSRKAAANACVLLKNDGVLPLAPTAKVALIGPLADNRENLQGTWAVAARPADSITVLEGFTAAKHNFVHAKGSNLIDDKNIAARVNVFGATFSIDERDPETLITEAVAVARDADVIVACVGEAKEHTGESSTRTTLTLPYNQRHLLAALQALGKPLVIVTMSGRPLVLEWEASIANALLHTWFAGSEAGPAIADVLYGVVNPSAKLAMSFPRDSGQCPIHYAEAPTGRPHDRIGVDVFGDDEVDAQGRHVFRKFTTACRIEGAHTALFPFGHGLGYSHFDYANLRAEKTALKGTSDVLRISVEVRNAGQHAGTEIVQLYVGDPVASRSRPTKLLKAFRRIELAAGTQQTVQFELGSEAFRYFLGTALSKPDSVFEPGAFVIHVGGGSVTSLQVAIEWQE